ncbi:MAG: hypothetical protein QXF76_05030 [Candidatus Anstonellales archaeon]
MKKLIGIFLVIISISGCFPSLRISESEYQIFKLTSEIAESRDRDFFVYLPPLWFKTKDVNYDGNEIWLVHENYSAVITIKKINLPKELKSNDDLERLLEIAKADAILHKRKYEGSFRIILSPKLYQNGNFIYSSFEYNFGNKQIARVMIFQKGENFFECLAYSTEKGQSKIPLIELYSVQESVTASLSLR